MKPRMELQTLLVELMDGLGIGPFVYFQPPPTEQMIYPCIVYKRDNANTLYSDNQLYKKAKRYMVTVIDRDPDSNIPDKVAELPLCSFDRFFTADGLNHDVFQLFF